jgi:hypothetical protein
VARGAGDATTARGRCHGATCGNKDVRPFVGACRTLQEIYIDRAAPSPHRRTHRGGRHGGYSRPRREYTFLNRRDTLVAYAHNIVGAASACVREGANHRGVPSATATHATRENKCARATSSWGRSRKLGCGLRARVRSCARNKGLFGDWCAGAYA